jgi:hypothetical protein
MLSLLAPLSIVRQDTINEYREIVLNWWLTHAMSFNVMKGMCYSVIH